MPMTTKNRSKSEDGTPNPVDSHVGHRLRLRRTMMGMSQEKLAQVLGVTFQQVQKYERGMNRVSASRLYHISRVLDVPVSYFFDELDPAIDQAIVGAAVPTGMAEDAEAYVAQPSPKRDTLELMRTYGSIESHDVRKQVLALVKSIARTDENAASVLSGKKAS